MFGYFTLIFACQLADELLVLAIGLPVPGPVVGMLVLLSGLLAAGRIPDELAAVGDFLLAQFSLLFVPAGVGIMLPAAWVSELPVTVLALPGPSKLTR